MPQSISQLRTGPVHQMPTPEVVKPSFALPNQVENCVIRFVFCFSIRFRFIFQQQMTHIGSSHNRAAMPFDARVGNEMTYQAAKPSNWQPGLSFLIDIKTIVVLPSFFSR